MPFETNPCNIKGYSLAIRNSGYPQTAILRQIAGVGAITALNLTYEPLHNTSSAN